MEAFGVDRARKGGRNYSCKECVASVSKAYRIANPERRRETTATYRAANAEKCKSAQRQWYVVHGERALAVKRAWAEKNRAARSAIMRRWHVANRHIKAAYKKRVREAIPPWADREAILAVYAEARRLTHETGIPHEVDHIIPLNGRLVSGLHVQGNLEPKPAAINRSKGNRFDPG